MQFFALIQSRLVSLFVGFLFLCTAVLGAVLMAVQRTLAWLDGQHPQLTQALQATARWLARHPKTISATLASVLLAGGGGAFAIANLGPDIAEQPVVIADALKHYTGGGVNPALRAEGPGMIKATRIQRSLHHGCQGRTF